MKSFQQFVDEIPLEDYPKLVEEYLYLRDTGFFPMNSFLLETTRAWTKETNHAVGTPPTWAEYIIKEILLKFYLANTAK